MKGSVKQSGLLTQNDEETVYEMAHWHKNVKVEDGVLGGSLMQNLKVEDSVLGVNNMGTFFPDPKIQIRKIVY